MSRSSGRPRVRRPGRGAARAGTGAASALYAANCLLGAAVGLRVLDTSRVHWVHHALYGAVVAGAAAAVATGDRKSVV